MLHREVLPVIRRRLELAAFFTGVSAVSFWLSALTLAAEPAALVCRAMAGSVLVAIKHT